MTDETKPTNATNAVSPDEARALAQEASGWHSPAITRNVCVTCETPWPCASHLLVAAVVESLAAQVERLKREAGKVILAFHDWPAHTSEFADSERQRALMDLAEEAER